MFCRDIEKDLIPFCENNNMSILCYGVLGGGILTGKYKDSPKLERFDVRSFFYKYYKNSFFEKSKKMVDFLENIAKEHKVPVSNVALNWVLKKDIVVSSLVGCRHLEQLKQNIVAVDFDLKDEEYLLIEEHYRNVFF